MAPSTLRAVLRVMGPDRRGLVADVATLLFREGANIVQADQHVDPDSGTFLQRIEVDLPPPGGPAERASLRERVGAACGEWSMRCWLRFSDEPYRVAIFASRRGHCVLDLLSRHQAGELDCAIPFVLSNHSDLESEVVAHGYRFVYSPIATGGDATEGRAAQEANCLALLADERIDLVVLARYMQVLSPGFVERWQERIINIHHSFLPAFAGADPYGQAYRLGVKLTGATSHYVTANLDQGPIIAQEVIPVTHRDAVADMVVKGRDLERRVLAHAVRCHLQDRIMTIGRKTVVFA